jgi:hypothetical protein
MQKLWDLIVANRETLTWLGSGAVALAGGIWAVVKHLFPSDGRKSRAASVALSGTGIASGGDTNITGTVNIGHDEAKIEQAMTAAIQPVVNELLDLRKTLARLAAAPGEQAILASQAQAALDRGDLAGVGGAVSAYEEYATSGRPPTFMRDKPAPGAKPWSNDKPWPYERMKYKTFSWEELEPLRHSGSGAGIKLRIMLEEQKLAQKLPKEVPNAVPSEDIKTLIAQWKTITDMTSNLSKDIDDRAMKSVRNLR